MEENAEAELCSGCGWNGTERQEDAAEIGACRGLGTQTEAAVNPTAAAGHTSLLWEELVEGKGKKKTVMQLC